MLKVCLLGFERVDLITVLLLAALRLLVLYLVQLLVVASHDRPQCVRDEVSEPLLVYVDVVGVTVLVGDVIASIAHLVRLIIIIAIKGAPAPIIELAFNLSLV